MAKKFHETKVGKFLHNKAPNILDVIGDVLPSNGLLGVVKNLIDNDSSLSHLDKMEGLDLIKQEAKVYELELKDKENARNREIELAKTDAPILSKIVVPLLAVMWSLFAFTLYVLLLTGVISNLESIQALVISSITNIVMLIIGYYFGSSKGSKDKQDHINNIN